MIKYFLMNLLLSFIWVALTGSLSYSNFIFGLFLGFAVLWVMSRNETDQRYFYRVPKILAFALYFIYQVIKANVQVAYDVMTPNYFFRPGVVRFPMNAKTDFEINILSMFISLTPGTLILDVSEDRKAIYIHVMYLTDPEKFINGLRTGVERRLLEVLR